MSQLKQQRRKILVVDDDAAVCQLLSTFLERKGYDCIPAGGAEAALEVLRNNKTIEIVISDLAMPGRGGLDLIRIIRSEFARDLEIIILSGSNSPSDAVAALRLGAQDFLAKPIDVRHLLHVVQRSERLLCLRRSERLSVDKLTAEVEVSTAELRELASQLEIASHEALDLLAEAAEYRDNETGSHIRRMGAYARLVAYELGWPEERSERIAVAAKLHDIGKIGIPDAVLLKPGKLDPDEVEIMKGHAQIGQKILSRASNEVLHCAAAIAGAHHERWDGTGYPSGLRQDETPIEARIVSLVDVYDALRSSRPYKPAFDHAKAVDIITGGDGRTLPNHFDPEIFGLFRDNESTFAQIFESFSNQPQPQA